ncbi:LPS assembly lipoprotein LptE [Oryzibacter oryziterrae]|uniref:LPS assembly lipoprotein LptE n=1 Tax=Oryzibacter oryziterrae TaxID=2766474 RepID=UPI001EFFE8F5|nr:LPS assembly lipoprotein LptE [Oryzibacter oryziterrae]
MSLHDSTRRAFVLALGGGLLAACQVRPVYAPVNGTSPTLAGLGSIAIEVQTDRVGQVLMNELVFALRGGAALVTPARYTLHLIVTSRATDLAIETGSDLPSAKLVALTVTYTLTEVATSRAVTTGNVYQTTSYDFSSQRYANVRAERDAEDRAAKAAAADIRLRLSSALMADGG